MRYKAYSIQEFTNRTSLYGGLGLVLARQGNDFVDAKELAGISNRDHIAYKTTAAGMANPKNCTELKDGVYFLKRAAGDLFVVPESNPFFNVDFLGELDDNETFSGFFRVKVLAIKYLQSLKS